MGELIYIGLTLLIGYNALHTWRRLWDVIDVPTVSPSGAVVGQCEIIGQAALAKGDTENKSVLSPISNQDCVWYQVLIEKYVTADDADHWVKYKKYCSTGGFRVADEYDSVLVIPDSANHYLSKSVQDSEEYSHLIKAYVFNQQMDKSSQTQPHTIEWIASPDRNYLYSQSLKKWLPISYVSPDGNHYYSDETNVWIPVKQISAVSNILKNVTDMESRSFWNGRFRVSETIIRPGEMVYVHGNFSLRPASSDLQVDSLEKGGVDTIVSTQGEKTVLASLEKRRTVFSIIFMIMMLFVFYQTVKGLLNSNSIMSVSNKDSTYYYLVAGLSLALTVVLIPSFFFFLKIIRTYNRFIINEERIRAMYSTIDVLLKRRSDLIPQLCDVIESMIEHERTTNEVLVRLRNETGSMDSEKQLSAISERYPNLKTSENYLFLQNELGRAEEKIAMARSSYNDLVLSLDNLRATIVGRLFSPFFPKVQYLKNAE